jgi:hypothetical protein
LSRTLGPRAVVAASGLNPVRFGGGDISPRDGPPAPIASKTETHSSPGNYVTVTFVAVVSPVTHAVTQHVSHIMDNYHYPPMPADQTNAAQLRQPFVTVTTGQSAFGKLSSGLQIQMPRPPLPEPSQWLPAAVARAGVGAQGRDQVSAGQRRQGGVKLPPGSSGRWVTP